VPVYGRFEIDYGLKAGLKIVLRRHDCRRGICSSAIEKYEQALARAHADNVNVRAVLIVNPNNPTG